VSLDGIVLVDKPEGPTSHDVVAKARRIYGTRKIGHAGTLDPMATGMLVLGIGKATRLLGYLTASDKEYLATIRLGQATNTDDAQGELISSASTSALVDEDILNAVRQFRGPISQKPSSVSAIKINGKRAYARVRDGEEIEIPARDVMIHDFEIISIEHNAQTIDVKVRVVCSAGTYIRALARDLGATLGVGGHLTELRRTRSGKFTQMRPLNDLENTPTVIDLPDAVKMTFPTVEISGDDIKRAKNGMRIPLPVEMPTGVVGVFSSDGEVISLSENSNSELVPLVVFAGD
jgi:tRNA pseudouridine55 synthase